MEEAKYVFISHRNTQHDLGITKRLYEYLSSQKLEAWYDQGYAGHGLRGGDYAAQISKKLHGASAYILIASKDSLRSDEVRDEIGNMRREQQKNGKMLIPLVLDDYYFNMDAGTTEDYFLGSNRNQAVVLDKFDSEEAAFFKITDYLKDVLQSFENNPRDFVFDDTHVVLKKYIGRDSIVTVPGFIREIAEDAFSFNETVKKVKIPPSVQIIGKCAFNGCLNLELVEGMEGVCKCGSSAFENTGLVFCENNNFSLNGVVIGGKVDGDELNLRQGVKVIADKAFYRSNFKTLVFSDGIEVLGRSAFACCMKLTKVVIPKTVRIIEKNAFQDCLKLEEVIFEGVLPEDYEKAFDKKTLDKIFMGD